MIVVSFFFHPLGAPSPGSAYSSSTAQQMARSAGAFAPAQNPSAFSAYHGYIPSNSAAANQSVSYPNAMPRVRGSGQMSSMFFFSLTIQF